MNEVEKEKMNIEELSQQLKGKSRNHMHYLFEVGIPKPYFDITKHHHASSELCVFHHAFLILLPTSNILKGSEALYKHNDDVRVRRCRQGA